MLAQNHFDYNSGSERGGHIVRQVLPYGYREKESDEVSYLMATRQKDRLKYSPETDKSINPLIALCGAPGSGKSSFLVNFPESSWYHEYLKSYHNDTAVVSTITFNSGMSGTPYAFGLRILFGAANAMGLELDSNIATWPAFYEYNKSYEQITARQAVRILRHIFGKHRPVLILVDELKEIEGKGDNEVICQIGEILSLHTYVDVVVSSLSPKYINDLITQRSKRKIQYVVLRPLLDFNLGSDISEAWSQTILSAVDGTRKVPMPIQTMLKNLYILFSSHPRSVEKMKLAMESKESNFNDAIIKALQLRNSQNQILFYTILNHFSSIDVAPKIISQMSQNDIENFIFSTIEYDVFDEDMRKLVEEGVLNLMKNPKGDEFIVGVKVLSLLRWLLLFDVDVDDSIITTQEKTQYPITTMAKQLLNELADESNYAVWWERIVALSLISRSYSTMALSNVLGIHEPNFNSIRRYKFQLYFPVPKSNYFDKVFNDSDMDADVNTLTVFRDNQAGFDSYLRVKTVKMKNTYSHVYMEVKVKNPSIKKSLKDTVHRTGVQTIEDIVAKSLCNIMRIQLKYNPDVDMIKQTLCDIHYILYNWGYIGNMPLDTNLLHTACKQYILGMDMTSSPNISSDHILELVFYYLEHYLEHIHIVGQNILKEWILPSFLPFPRLFSVIESDPMDDTNEDE